VERDGRAVEVLDRNVQDGRAVGGQREVEACGMILVVVDADGLVRAEGGVEGKCQGEGLV
jgi:hypothetical protein